MPDDDYGKEMMAEGEGPMPAETPAKPDESEDSDGYDGELCISQSDLPKGMKPKAGDVLPFRVTSFGEGGDIYLTFAGKAGGMAEEQGESWEDQFRADMSPQSNETPQVPEEKA